VVDAKCVIHETWICGMVKLHIININYNFMSHYSKLHAQFIFSFSRSLPFNILFENEMNDMIMKILTWVTCIQHGWTAFGNKRMIEVWQSWMDVIHPHLSTFIHVHIHLNSHDPLLIYLWLVGTHDLRPLGSPPISLNRKGPWTKVKTKNMTVDV
jgi:hypothetical protein